MYSKVHSRPSTIHSSRNRIVGFFPGLGSRSAYKNLGHALLESGFSGVTEIYREAAQALGFAQQPEKLLLIPENIPRGGLERQGYIGAAFLVHSLALEARLRAEAEKNGVPIGFVAYTGESFGIVASAVSSGSLSCGDGVKIAQAFTPLMILAAEGGAAEGPFAERIASYLPGLVRERRLVAEPFHVVALKGAKEDVANLLECMQKYLGTDVEVHKLYSWRQTNVYVRTGAKPRFDLFLKNFPDVEAEEIKEPTTFLAHSKRMRCVRNALDLFIDESRIVFKDPCVPVISNHGMGFLTTADEVRDGVLSIVDNVMSSMTTVETLRNLNPDLVVELGLGNKSVQLLNDNGAQIPVMAYSGTETETSLLLSTAKLVDDLQREMAKLQVEDGPLEERHYHLLRELFRLASTGHFCEKYLFQTMFNAITSQMLCLQRDRSRTFHQFLETFQHTYRHQENIDVGNGDLILQARLKNTIVGHQKRLGQVYAEIKVLDRKGDIADQSVLSGAKPTEVVVLHFERLEHLVLAEVAKYAQLLVRTQPQAREIYEGLQRHLHLENQGFLMLEGDNVFTVDQIAVSHIAYQFTLFHILRLYRSAIFTQRDCYIQGSDPIGWLIALAVSEATTLVGAVALYSAYLRSGPGSEELKAALEEMFVSLKPSVVPVISHEGIPIQSKRDLEIATLAVFLHGALKRETCRIQLNASCHIIAIGSTLTQGMVDAWPHKPNVITVSNPEDIWMKRLNPVLDEFENLCISTLTVDNELVLHYAKARRLLGSTVCAYVNVGERIVGFGKGGSESMTIFLKREVEEEIVVRKILSEALTAARWDPKGEGVMLPPFAKAKKQAEYLLALPEMVRPFFPRVHAVLARDIPITSHLRKEDKATHKEVIYEMSYVPGEEVSRFVERCSPPAILIARLYEQICQFLKRHVHSINRTPAPGGTLEISYFKKIEDRLDLCRRTAPRTFCNELLGAERIVINGISYINLCEIVRRFRERSEYLDILEPRFHSLVMGDTNTENIKIGNVEPLLTAQRLIEEGAPAARVEEALEAITASSIGIRFLDPRAIGFKSDGGNTCDDAMYDNKPWHNCLGHYDEIHYEHFDMQVRFDEEEVPHVDIAFDEHSPFRRSYRVRDVEEKGGKVGGDADSRGMEDYFAYVMNSLYGGGVPDSPEIRDDPYWLIRFVFVMGTHFAAMPPFHFVTELDGTLTDTYETQRRPLAIYSEGIKWLNWALQMLEGKRKEFLGVLVPPVPHLIENEPEPSGERHVLSSDDQVV